MAGRSIALGIVPLGGGSGSGGDGLSKKTGVAIPSQFTGTPKTATITFLTPFISSNYSVTVTAEGANGLSFLATYSSKTASGFIIELNADNLQNLVSVSWQAILNGETT